MITNRLHVAYSSIFSQKMEIVIEDVSHFDVDAWCIITVCGVLAFTVDTQAILQREKGFPRDCLRGGRVSKLARLTDAMGKGNFHIILFTKVFLTR